MVPMYSLHHIGHAVLVGYVECRHSRALLPVVAQGSDAAARQTQSHVHGDDVDGGHRSLRNRCQWFADLHVVPKPLLRTATLFSRIDRVDSGDILLREGLTLEVAIP